MTGRDQLAIVRELAFDQPCRQPCLADLEGGIAITQAHGQFFAATDQPLQLVEGTPWYEHLLVGTEHLVVGEVTDREAIRVGRHHAQAPVLGGQQHTGQDRPSLVGAGGPDDLTQGLAHRRCRQGDRRGGRRCQLRVVVERQRSHAELRAPTADVDLIAVDRDLDLAGAHRTHDVGRKTGRQDHAAITVATDCEGQLDRQIEIGAGDAQPVADEFEAQT